MKTRTYTAGANAERTSILAHVRRLNARYETTPPDDVLFRLIGWLLKRNERYNRKTRGVGR